MKVNNSDINIDEAIKLSELDNIILKRRKNNFLLSDYQISVLRNNDIDYLKYVNIHELLFDIEEILNQDFDSQLDSVSREIQEYIYYNETKK